MDCPHRLATHRPARHQQFTAHDPVTEWTCAQAWRRATGHNARRFLDKLQTDMPFPIEATQVDGGSGSRPTSRPNASAAASTCSNSRHARPSSTDTSSATTAPGDTSSTPHGTCLTTTSTTSTDGSTPSLTSFNTFRPRRPLADTPPPSTLPDTQPKNPLRLICPEPGHRVARPERLRYGRLDDSRNGRESRGFRISDREHGEQAAPGPGPVRRCGGPLRSHERPHERGRSSPVEGGDDRLARAPGAGPVPRRGRRHRRRGVQDPRTSVGGRSERGG